MISVIYAKILMKEGYESLETVIQCPAVVTVCVCALIFALTSGNPTSAVLKLLSNLSTAGTTPSRSAG